MSSLKFLIFLFFFTWSSSPLLAAAEETKIEYLKLLPVPGNILGNTHGTTGRILYFKDYLIVSWNGIGQNCANGGVKKVSLLKGGGISHVLEFGMNEDLVPKTKSLATYPYLLGSPAKNQYLLIVNSGKKFPDKEIGPWDMKAGNIILYNSKLKTLENLSNLDGTSKECIEAIKWFPESGILLMEKGKPDGQDTPSIVPGTGKPFYLVLKTRKFSAVSKIKKIKEWYVDYKKFKIDHRLSKKGKTNLLTFSFLYGESKKLDENKKLFSFTPIIKLDEDPRALQLGGGLWIVTHSEIGSYLIDKEGTLAVQISKHIVVDYNKGNLMLQSKSDADGQRKYWLLNLNSYFEYLKRRVSKVSVE